MKLPKQIRMMQSVYKIRWCDKIGKSNSDGTCNVYTKTILISSDLKKKEKQAIQTLWHEIVHAYVFESGLSQLVGRQVEEMICESLANFLRDAVGGKIKSSR